MSKLEVTASEGEEMKHFREGIGERRREIQFVQSHLGAARRNDEL